jgi:transketolase
MRNAFIEELVALAAQHDHLSLIVGDLGFSVVEPFIDRFPDRFVNAGVAEQNMTGLAAGMASEGFHAFTYSIANFPTFRCAEQIRNDVDYLKMPVTVVAVGGGLSYGALGYSHHAVQDMALLRVMPNMTIAAPGDPMEVRACMRYLVDNPGPSYLRLGKAGEKSHHPKPPEIKPGVWCKVKSGHSPDGKRRAILTTGASLQSAMEWAADADLAAYDVFSMPLWGMQWKKMQAQQALPFEQIVTLEDHFLDGGFGSWMREALALTDGYSGKLVTIGLDPSVRDMVGSQDSMNAAGGLNLESVKAAIR